MKQQNVKKANEHVIDASGRAVGRVATDATRILTGKHMARYARDRDMGESVRIIHAKQVSFSGRKLAQKDYRHHTMHPGGLKVTSMQRVFEKDPGSVLRRAIHGMLPKNSFRKKMMKRLFIDR